MGLWEGEDRRDWEGARVRLSNRIQCYLGTESGAAGPGAKSAEVLLRPHLFKEL